MNGTQRRRHERLERGDAFASANAADFPLTSKGGQAAAEIKEILAQTEVHETSRVSSMNSLQQATVGKKDERESLRALLRAMSDTTKTIGLDHPEVKGGFKFKGASVSDQSLLATARAFADASLPLKDLFIEYDIPSDFHDVLKAKIVNFEQYMNRQTAETGGRVAANASLEDALHRGEAALERLDTAVRNKYRNDPAKLAAWESARRLERAPRKKNEAGDVKKGEGKGEVSTPPSHAPTQ
jgi:hypothetical protein